MDDKNSSRDYKKELLKQNKTKLKEEIKNVRKTLPDSSSIQSYSQGVIVGEKSYPRVKLMPLSNDREDSNFLNESNLVKKNYSDIIKVKARNIAGLSSVNIKEKPKLVDDVREVVASKKPLQYESVFQEKINVDEKILLNKLTGIIGSKNQLKKIKKGNTSINNQVEKTLTEDFKAHEAVMRLYDKDVNETQIISLFTLGSFGYSFSQRMVPSRWGITAYDTIVSSNLYERIKHNDKINKNLYFFSEDKGNRFHVFMFPGKHTFENIEIVEGGKVIKDYLISNKNIEPNTAGGFYATRLAVIEFLYRIKRQASVLVIREINDYDIPLGVIFVRETVREALKRPFTFEKVKELSDKLPPRVFRVLNESKTVSTKTLLDYSG